MAVRKLVTFSDSQWDSLETQMQSINIESLSEHIRALSRFYDENKRRPAGRPRSKEEQEDDDTQDTIEMYQHPQPTTTSPYSYNDLKAWYEFNNLPMPARSELVVHKSHRK